MTTAAARRALGAYGEEVAARYLIGHGLTLLDRNWRCAQGEIDLVLTDGRVVVVCEVKTRAVAQGAGTPHEALTPTKAARLQRLAQLWIGEHGLGEIDVRVDLVAVLRPDRGRAVVEHVPAVA